MAQHEEAFAAWTKRKNFQKGKQGNSFQHSQGNTYQNSQGNYKNTQGGSNQNYRGNNNFPNQGGQINSKDAMGRILQCRNCMSIRHLQRECPYNPKNQNANRNQRTNKQAFVIEGENSGTEDDIPEHILKEIEAERDAEDDTQKHIFFTTDEN